MVYLKTCDCYDPAVLSDAIGALLEGLGGMERFVSPGDRVLIKPNLLAAKAPSAATTTHPQVVAEVARRVIEAGGKPIIADSPGGPYQKTLLKNLYHVCGMDRAAEESGAELNFNTDVVMKDAPNGQIAKSFAVIRPFAECDKVIDLAKLKSHSMTYYTGAVKNMFGLIGGLTKAEYHMRYSEKQDFCTMLVDLCEFAHPVLSIIDGIVGMEGDGPSNGTPRGFGVLIGSASPYLCDLAAMKLIGAEVRDVLPIALAVKRGLCPLTVDGSLAGDPIEPLMISDFAFPKAKSVTFDDHIPKVLTRVVNRVLLPFPRYDHSRCIGCMHCASVCPAGALTKKKGFPSLDRKKCIRCYCCQELCPKNAVILKKRK